MALSKRPRAWCVCGPTRTLLSHKQSSICRGNAKSAAHWCCEGCTSVSRLGNVRRCKLHSTNQRGVSAVGTLWYESVVNAALTQCPLGCWVKDQCMHSARDCPRALRGPISDVRGRKFSTFKAFRAAKESDGVVFIGNHALKVVTCGTAMIPTALRVVVPCYLSNAHYCVVWKDAQQRTFCVHAFVNKWMSHGSEAKLFPSVEFNALGKPVNIVIQSITCVQQTDRVLGAWGPLYGTSWLKVAAIFSSPCAAQRWMALTNAAPRLAKHDGGIECENITLCAALPSRPPRFRRLLGRVVCMYCGETFQSMGHFYASCVPDSM